MITLQAMPPVSIRNQVPIQVRNGKYAGQFYTFHGLPDGKEHIAIAFGEAPGRTPLVRVHSECLTGDIFGSQLCDCGQQLSEAMDRLTEDGGYLIYLRQEGRGIGLYAKLDSYKLQHEGLDTFEANHRLNFPSDLRRPYRRTCPYRPLRHPPQPTLPESQGAEGASRARRDSFGRFLK
jgi:GTP cyclohydrolase II